MKIRIKNRKFEALYIMSVIIMFIIQITYGHSGGLYTLFMILFILYCAYCFVKNINKYPKLLVLICLYNLIVPLCLGIFIGTIQDAPMTWISLSLPLVIASKKIDLKNIEKGSLYVFILMVVINFLKKYIPYLNTMNINSYSFLMLNGFTSAYIYYQYNKKSLFRLFCCIYVSFVMIASGSRNAFSISVIMLMLSVIPIKILTNKIVYRITYFIAIGYQIFSIKILNFFNTNNFFNNIFENQIQPLFNKSWGIDSRIDIYSDVSNEIWHQDIFNILFGNGEAFKHAHNGFYQCMHIYGLIGTILILIMCIYIFEKALTVYKITQEPIYIGIIVCFIGLLLLQGADVFLYGVKTCIVVPFFLISLIIRSNFEIGNVRKNGKSRLNK